MFQELAGTDFDKDCHDNDREEQKEQLLEVPGAPEYPLLQAHHQHSLTNTGLLLKDQLLQRCVVVYSNLYKFKNKTHYQNVESILSHFFGTFMCITFGSLGTP